MFSNLATITRENASQLQVVGTLEGHTAPVLSIATTLGGQLLASGSMDGTARVWNLDTQEQVNVFAANPENEQISRVAFSPANPDHLATAIGRKPSWAMSDVRDYVGNLAQDMFSHSRGKPVWRLWSLEEETVVHTEAAQYALLGTAGLAYSRNQQWLAAMDGVWDITTVPYARAARLTEYHVRDMAFSADSERLALVAFYEQMPESIMHHMVEIYHTATWQPVAEISETWRITGFSDVCFLPNTHDLLVRTSVESLRAHGAHRLYRYGGDRFEESTRILSDVACFAPHPDGSIVAIARYDGHMVLLDADRHRPLATVRAYQPAQPVNMPRGFLIGGTDVVNAAARSQYRAAQDMVFSPDGRLLISADGDQVLRIWGIPT
ncbi:MAG: hypothetical protein GYB65_05895 [Chloroflexi bacterium]|nr:hypothetical protein [Chloroflexota bacterium]